MFHAQTYRPLAFVCLAQKLGLANICIDGNERIIQLKNRSELLRKWVG